MNIIYYDLETTGTNVNFDRMIEIAAYKENTNTYYHKLVNTDYPIHPKASEVNGITHDMIKNKKYFKDLIDDFEDFMFSNNLNIIYLISHNNYNFDRYILKCEYKRVNRDFPNNIIFVDTLPISRYLFPKLKNHKLGTLLELFNIKTENQHEALDDVNSLYKIYQEFRKINNDLELFNISKKFIMNKMPFGKYKNQYIKDIPEDYVKWMKLNIFSKPLNKDLEKAFTKYNPHF